MTVRLQGACSASKKLRRPPCHELGRRPIEPVQRGQQLLASRAVTGLQGPASSARVHLDAAPNISARALQTEKSFDNRILKTQKKKKERKENKTSKRPKKTQKKQKTKNKETTGQWQKKRKRGEITFSFNVAWSPCPDGSPLTTLIKCIK